MNMFLTCTAIDNTGDYTHYTLSGPITLKGHGVDDSTIFSFQSMNRSDETQTYEYGKTYKFNFSQGE